MSLATLERAIREEAQRVFKNSTLRNKDILEWSTGELATRDGEVVVYLPDIGAYVTIAVEKDRRPK